MEAFPKSISNIKSNYNNYNIITSNNSYNNSPKGIQINFPINSFNNKEKKFNIKSLKDENLDSFKKNLNNFFDKSLSNRNYSLEDNEYNRIDKRMIQKSPTNNNLKSTIKLRKNRVKYPRRQNSTKYPTNIETQINNISFSSQVKINNNFKNNININNNNNNKKYNKIKNNFKVKKLNHCPTNNCDFGKNNK
jgi:hypothetical protein